METQKERQSASSVVTVARHSTKLNLHDVLNGIAEKAFYKIGMVFGKAYHLHFSSIYWDQYVLDVPALAGYNFASDSSEIPSHILPLGKNLKIAEKVFDYLQTEGTNAANISVLSQNVQAYVRHLSGQDYLN